MSESMLPSFPNTNIWPYELLLTNGQTVTVNAASERQARKQALRRFPQRVAVESVTTLVVTSEQMHRILAA